jgi:phosphohistidine phosphatase
MDLILLRHGKAEDDNPKGDSARKLVGKGREQSARAARLLKHAGRLPAIVLTSPYARARETAEIFCETAGMPGPVSQSWLACGMSPDTALAELAGFNEFDRILIVGHEPDFSHLVTTLLGAAAGAVQVKKGALVGIRIAPPSKRGTLRFLIPPKLAEEE